MIEKAPGFEIGALISESGSFFKPLLLLVGPLHERFLLFGPLHALHYFMFFLFRLLESQPRIGIESRP